RNLEEFLPMKFQHQKLAIIISTALVWCASLSSEAQTSRDAVETLRSDVKADRKVIIAEAMQLSDRESEAFWPVYRNYRAEAEQLSDGIVKLVLEYADLYPNLPEDKANEMLSQYLKTEEKLLALKRKYLKKFGKILPPSKVFRFAQVDNRLDLGVRAGLAASIPILPTGQKPRATEQR